MYRPYEHHTQRQLGDEFAAAIRMGGRPVIRTGQQLAYADIVLEILLEEFRSRDRETTAALLDPPVEADCDCAYGETEADPVPDLSGALAEDPHGLPF